MYITLILRVLHIIFVIFWMGAMLYVPFVLAMQAEANSKTEPDRSGAIKQLKSMSKGLWFMVAWPSLILVIVVGASMMHPYFSSPWFWVKMILVSAMVVHHHAIHFSYKALQKDKYEKTPSQLRTMAQTTLVLMLGIVALAIMRDAVNNILIGGGIVIAAVLIFLVVKSMLKSKPKK